MKTIFLTDDRDPVARKLVPMLESKGYRIVSNCLSGEPVTASCRQVTIELSESGPLTEILSGLGDSLCGVLHPMPPFRAGALEDAADRLWEQVLDDGPLAAVNVAKAAGEVFARSGKGSVVFLGDLHAEKPTGCAPFYSMACGAVQMLCREAALDYGAEGVSFHFLQRGVMDTDLDRKHSRSNLYSAPELQYPSGRLQRAEELTGLVSFLFSGEGNVLNGADLRADQGLSMYYGKQLRDEEIEALVQKQKEMAQTPEEFVHGPVRTQSMKGRVALITGGGKGVGAGIARVFCAAGMKVCIGWNTSEALAHKTLAEIKQMGGEAFLFQADISDREQIRAMVEETVLRYGGIDVLVNNAALQPNLFLKQYDTALFRRLWNINVGGYWRSLQLCLPYLRKSRYGRVINISSIHGKRPTVFDPGYAMTKGAVRMFTREAALELAEKDITVNAVELGYCRIEGKTGNYLFRIEKPPQTVLNSPNPLSRVCEPEDAGFLALYLASSEAATLTGAGVRLDGGSMMV